ncbi:hypothetical protein MN1_020 [Thermus phage MN1]|nr:hypothetical protein MN1_020 [Thermus phage MN1]
MARLLGPTWIGGDKRLTHLYISEPDFAGERYYKLATINKGFGILNIRGILGGHTPTEGRATVDVNIAARNELTFNGVVAGRLDRSDILVVDPGSSSTYVEVWLATKSWGLVNLDLSASGVVSVVYDGTYTTSAPTGLQYYLSRSDILHNYGGLLRVPSAPSSLPVSWTLGSGVYAANSSAINYQAHILLMSGGFVQILLRPLSLVHPTETGFRGEGEITFSLYPLEEFKNLGITQVNGIASPAAALTTIATMPSIIHDNEYNLRNVLYHPSF